MAEGTFCPIMRAHSALYLGHILPATEDTFCPPPMAHSTFRWEHILSSQRTYFDLHWGHILPSTKGTFCPRWGHILLSTGQMPEGLGLALLFINFCQWSFRTLAVTEVLGYEPLELRMRGFCAQFFRYPVLVDHAAAAQNQSAAKLSTQKQQDLILRSANPNGKIYPGIKSANIKVTKPSKLKLVSCKIVK